MEDIDGIISLLSCDTSISLLSPTLTLTLRVAPLHQMCHMPRAKCATSLKYSIPHQLRAEGGSQWGGRLAGHETEVLKGVVGSEGTSLVL